MQDFTLNPQTERIRTVSQKVLDGVKDMVELDDLTEGTLLHNLRVRYNASEIYVRMPSSCPPRPLFEKLR